MSYKNRLNFFFFINIIINKTLHIKILILIFILYIIEFFFFLIFNSIIVGTTNKFTVTYKIF